MQLQVKQLGRALSHESTSESASANLNKLTSMLFNHTRTAEEAYYVGEMAHGADVAVASKVRIRSFFDSQPHSNFSSVHQQRFSMHDYAA